MASGSYRQVYIGCPFYRYDDGKRKIRCEGIVDDSNIVLDFKKREDYELHINIFCCDKYKNCEVYRMLMDIKDV